jgi:hypothetical protein
VVVQWKEFIMFFFFTLQVGGVPVERIYQDVTGPVVLKDGSKSLVIKADPKACT